MNIKNDITELIGNTPLVYLNKLNNTSCKIALKLECFNPTSSVKDRPALRMIEVAQKEGLITKHSVIIEPTSGNTGIGLAMVCAVKGYKLILTMPETMSKERRQMLIAYGAKLVLTKGELGMQGAIDKAKELLKEYPNSFMPSQFDNENNPQVHYETTADEILRDTNGYLDIFVAGVGTGGTISGCARKFKKVNSKVQVVAIEPAESAVISGESKGPHGIQGIGAGFIPQNFDVSLIDRVIKVSTTDAIITAQNLAKKEGVLCGISSGAAVFGALKIAQENKDKLIVVLVPDYGERYLSTALFS